MRSCMKRADRKGRCEMAPYVTKHARQRGVERLALERTGAAAKLRWLFGTSRPLDHSELPRWYARPRDRIPGTSYHLAEWITGPVILVVRLAEAGPLLVTVVTCHARLGRVPRQTEQTC